MNTTIQAILGNLPTPKQTYTTFFKQSLVNVIISLGISILVLLVCFIIESVVGFHGIAPFAIIGGLFSAAARFPTIQRFRSKVLQFGDLESPQSLFSKVFIFLLLLGLPWLIFDEKSVEDMGIFPIVWFFVVAVVFRLAFALVQTLSARRTLSSFLCPLITTIPWNLAWNSRLIVACLEGCPQSFFTWKEAAKQLETKNERIELLSQLNTHFLGKPMSVSKYNGDSTNGSILSVAKISNLLSTTEHYSAPELQDMVLLGLKPGFTEKDLQVAYMNHISNTQSEKASTTQSTAISEAYQRLQTRFTK